MAYLRWVDIVFGVLFGIQMIFNFIAFLKSTYKKQTSIMVILMFLTMGLFCKKINEYYYRNLNNLLISFYSSFYCNLTLSSQSFSNGLISNPPIHLLWASLPSLQHSLLHRSHAMVSSNIQSSNPIIRLQVWAVL
jgi:hypothetical protein